MFEDQTEPLRLPQSPDLFDVGHVCGTPGAVVAMIENEVDPSELVMRHVLGFWGDIDPEDRIQNEVALDRGGRIFSAYILATTGQKVWVITEADRSTTTILLPSEY